MAGTGQGWASENNAPSWKNNPYKANDGRPEIHTYAQFADSSSIDAFGRLRISTPKALWDNKNIHDRNKTLWEEPLVGAIIVYENLAVSTFEVAETVTGATSGTIGTVTAVDGGSLTITYTVNHNDFEIGEEIEGGTSGATADIVTANTGSHISHDRDEASVILQVGASSGDSAVRHTHRYFNYISGKGQRVDITFILGAAVTNVRRRVGYFDDNNGIFFEQDSSGLRFVIRTKTSGSVVDNKTEQAVWNLDTLDGNGNSGITLDVTKGQIFSLDFQWLGVGRVRFGFNIDGKEYLAHEAKHSNDVTLPYISTPSLPVRYEISNTGATAGTNTFREICSSVASEAGEAINGIGFAKSNNATGISTPTGALKPILLIRLKSSYGGGENRKTAELTGFSIFTVTKDAHFGIKHIHDPITTGGSWVSIGNDSAVEYNVTATAVTGTEAHSIDEGYAAAGSGSRGGVAEMKKPDKNDQYRFLTQNTDSTNSQVFAIVAEGIGGTATVYSHMAWIESD